MDKIKLSSLLDKPIAFHPALARKFGSINAAIFWQQIYYWRDKGKRTDGFIYKTKEELEEETTLSPYQQDKVRKELEEQGFLETKLIKANGAPTLHYRINNGMLRNLIIQSEETEESDYQETKESITENTQRVTPSEQSSQSEIRIVKDDEDPEGKVFAKRKVSNKEVLGVLNDFHAILGVDITGWGVNTTQRRAIGNLLSRSKTGEPRALIRRALEYVAEHRDDKYMKWIFSPDDLDKNWNHIKRYKDENGD